MLQFSILQQSQYSTEWKGNEFEGFLDFFPDMKKKKERKWDKKNNGNGLQLRAGRLQEQQNGNSQT